MNIYFCIESGSKTRTWRQMLPVFLCLALNWVASDAWAAGSGQTDIWQSRISQIRLLAERDAPAALKDTQGLQAEIPRDTPPAEHVSLMNLLSRIEIYLLKQPDHAEWHAQEALNLAMRHGDRVGQGEADLNLAWIALSQGQLARQDEHIFHALALLRDSDRPDLLVEAMVMASMIYRRNGLASEAGDMAMHALELAQQSGSPVALTHAYQGLAYVLSMSQRDAEARDYFERMRKQAHACGQSRQEALAVLGLARLSTGLGNLQEANDLVRMAIDIDRRGGFSAALASDLVALAYNLRRQGRMPEAIKIMDDAVGIFEAHPHKSGLWWALYTRSEILEAAGRNGRIDVERIMRLADELGLPLYRQKSARRMGDIAASRGEWQHAYEYTAKAVEVLEQATNDESGQEISKVVRQFEADRQQRRVDELAHENERQQTRQRWLMTVLTSSAILLVGMVAFLVIQRRSHHLLTESHRQLQLSKDALQESEKRYRLLVEHMPTTVVRYDADGRRLLANPAFYHVTGMTEATAIGKTPEDNWTVSNISAQKFMAYIRRVAQSGQAENILLEVPDLAHDGKHHVYDHRLVPEYGADGVVGLLGISNDITELKEMESLLRESQSMLRALSERNETIREAERRHLAREVHDELGQMLNAIRLNLVTLEFKFSHGNPDMREMLSRTVANLNSTIGMARNIVAALYPTVLDAGIAAALDWQVKEFGKNTGIICDLLVDEDIVLDVMQTIAVYRIVQESLTNVARHSGARRVDVSLVRDDDMCQLEIIDDGDGFDVSRPKSRKSLGLIAMKERAIMLGGNARLTSEPGSGASLRVDFPLQRPVADAKLV